MGSERVTENIVRQHFQDDPNFKKVIFEFQGSENNVIKNLLKNASKTGAGRGMPEFVIQFKERSNFVILVECKANIKDHQEAEKDAKHYSSFVAREYDVLSIAVSGQNIKNLKISHFFHLRNSPEFKKIFGSEFLKIKEYEKGCMEDDSKLRQDYDNLASYSERLNKKLHSSKYKIPENLRALLVSGILIALQQDSFAIDDKNKKKKESKEIADDLILAIVRALQKAKVDAKKISNLEQQYGFIKTHRQLSEDEDNLYDLINEINFNVNNFIKTYKYLDVIGKFYVEFLKYANGDKSLGIVLTPPHITDFFCEIAGVNKDSIVLDNCTGTGGFLISAMKKMIDDAKNDEEKIKRIKANQLIGIESQGHVFALACSNMIIHKDGKSNIYYDSCFNEEIVNSIKDKHKPSIGMLNPPYRSEKEDIQELEFVLNNLEMLSIGGKCIAIIPTSCVLATTGDEYELKKKLLEKHTLEAVFSMPDQLFYPVGVITSVVLLTAHKPHKNSWTYLGFYKDDGFVVRRHKGRLENSNVWESVKKRWVDGFKSGVPQIGFAEKKQLTARDEWCAEVYMETDYSKLTEEDFLKVIREYMGYKITYDLSMSNKVNHNAVKDGKIKLAAQDWKYFKISELFIIDKASELSGDVSEIGTQLISTSYFNNGVVGYLLAGKKLFEKNKITVACNGAAIGTTFYQDKDFYSTADINVLIPKFALNEFIGLFLSVIIRKEKYRFNYGRKWGKERMLETTIKLPATAKGLPDWQFMENYIKSLPYSKSLDQ